MSIIDPGEEYSRVTVTVYYWALPQPLYRAGDIVLLPTTRPLELLTLVRTIGTHGKREQSADRYRQEFDAEISKAIAMNPSFRLNVTRDRIGRHMTYGNKDIFKSGAR